MYSFSCLLPSVRTNGSLHSGNWAQEKAPAYSQESKAGEILQGIVYAAHRSSSQAVNEAYRGVLRTNTGRPPCRACLRLYVYQHSLLLRLEGQGRTLPESSPRDTRTRVPRGRGLCSVGSVCSTSEGSVAACVTASKLRRRKQSNVDPRYDDDGTTRPSTLGPQRIICQRHRSASARRLLPLALRTSPTVYLSMQANLRVAASFGV